MSDTINIFIVDDDPLSRMIITDELQGDKYEIHEFSNGRECIDNLDLKPDLILMDVEMPIVNGYQACRELKKDIASQLTEVIFISSHDTTEEKLAGYDAGGSDYIIKPIQPLEVKLKIDLAIKNIQQHREKASEADTAMQTAITAISNVGEQGIILDFTRKSYSIEQVDDLAKNIIENLAMLGLDVTVQMRLMGKNINYSGKDTISPLEGELLSRLKDSGRIHEHGARLIINYGGISLLVKNMPIDEEKRGRLRDHLVLLLEIADERLKSLMVEIGLNKVISDAKRSLRDIEAMQHEQKGAALHIMDTLMTNLEQSFMTCGLTEDQEKMLLGIVQQGVDHSLDNFEQGLKTDEELGKIISMLENFSSK